MSSLKIGKSVARSTGTRARARVLLCRSSVRPFCLLRSSHDPQARRLRRCRTAVSLPREKTERRDGRRTREQTAARCRLGSADPPRRRLRLASTVVNLDRPRSCDSDAFLVHTAASLLHPHIALAGFSLRYVRRLRDRKGRIRTAIGFEAPPAVQRHPVLTPLARHAPGKNSCVFATQ